MGGDTDTRQDFQGTRNVVKMDSKTSNCIQEGQVQEKERMQRVPLYKLFSYADFADRVLMTIGTIGAIGNGFSVPFMCLILGEAIDAFGSAQRHETVSYVSKVSLKLIYIAMGCGVAAFLQVACWMVTGERQAARVRNLYLKAILRQEIAYFDQEVSTGEVIGRISGDTVLIHDAIGEKVGKFIQVVASFLGGFVVAFIKGWRLTLVILLLVPFIIAVGSIMYFLRTRMASRSHKAHANAANIVQQTIGSIRTVASLTMEKQVVANYKRFLTSSYKADTSITLNTGLESGFNNLLVLSCYGLGIWFGARMVLQGGYTGGDVFTILIAVILGSSLLGQASPSLVAFSRAQVASFKIFETIERTSSIDAYNAEGKLLNDLCGDIELRDVSFIYPSRPNEQILREFSLLIPSGTTAALVGQSGSGKSTVISLIQRLYDPQSGQVLIDGFNVKELQLKWMRSKIGIVSQEPVLFTGSIKDNIAYGKESATSEEIIAATELANINDFINRLPQGIDTQVGERGIQLSGGQKQRVAIARAILKDPKILLLDEATSALDADSERIVRKALEEVKVNRTTIIVAHRLSTIRDVHMIAVLHQGKIVEKGTHFELLKDPTGIYSNLISSQEANNTVKQNLECKSDIAMNGKVEYVDLGQGSSGMKRNTDDLVSTLTNTSALANDNPTSREALKGIRDVSIHQLAQLNKLELLMLIGATASAIITGAILPFFALLMSSTINAFYQTPHKLKKDSEFLAKMLFTLGVISFIAYPSRSHLFGMVGNKLIQRTRLKCFEKVVNMEMSWFDRPENSSGVIGARLSTDAAVLCAVVGDNLSQLVQQAASITVGLAIAFEASWQLSLVVLTLIPMIGFNGYIRMKSIKGFGKNTKVQYEEASQVANDAIDNIRTVAAFCAQDKILKVYEEKCQGPVIDGIKQGLISGVGFGLSICSLYIVYTIIFYAGAHFVQDGKNTASDVFRVYYAVNMVGYTISYSSSLATDSTKAMSAANSIFVILEMESKIDPSDDSGMIPENITGELELKDVNFSYPSRPDIQIFQGLSLKIHSGEVFALVGESGSGKSTVISLLQRFYDPNSGHITIDGIQIHKLQLKWLRQQMGLVSQEPVLFNDTIHANIASAKGGTATEAEIIAAAKLANAHEFISSLQQGYNTLVGEHGIQLSGGQKQRVAIARALVKSPKILLFDEATSALDAESEKIVQAALERVMKNKTTIVVAHRLSTIRSADIIAVFKNGSIVEKGCHDTLIDMKNGVYSSLVGLHTAALS